MWQYALKTFVLVIDTKQYAIKFLKICLPDPVIMPHNGLVYYLPTCISTHKPCKRAWGAVSNVLLVVNF